MADDGLRGQRFEHVLVFGVEGIQARAFDVEHAFQAAAGSRAAATANSERISRAGLSGR